MGLPDAVALASLSIAQDAAPAQDQSLLKRWVANVDPGTFGRPLGRPERALPQDQDERLGSPYFLPLSITRLLTKTMLGKERLSDLL